MVVAAAAGICKAVHQVGVMEWSRRALLSCMLHEGWGWGARAIHTGTVQRHEGSQVVP